MSNTPQLLSFLVADLIRAENQMPIPPLPDLLEQFLKDPESVMNTYGLGPKAKAALFTMDRQLIGQFMLEEILSTPSLATNARWADPVAKITSVQPNSLLAAPGQVVTIIGDFILSSAAVHLVAVGAFNHFTAVPVLQPTPPKLDGEVMVATFDLSEALAGVYEVLVYNTPSSPPLRADARITVTDAA